MIIATQQYKKYKAATELVKDMQMFLLAQPYDKLLTILEETRIRMMQFNGSIFEAVRAREIFFVGVKRGSPEIAAACLKIVEHLDDTIQTYLSSVPMIDNKTGVNSAISEVIKDS